MNATITETQTPAPRSEHPLAPAPAARPAAPATLEGIVKAICFDATYDSLKFILRSDTGHDGE